MHELQNNGYFTKMELYDVIRLLLDLDSLEKLIFVSLIKIFPNAINISDLTRLIGYSSKSKHVSRSNVLKNLENQKIIKLSKQQKSKLVYLNSENKIVSKIISIFMNNEKLDLVESNQAYFSMKKSFNVMSNNISEEIIWN